MKPKKTQPAPAPARTGRPPLYPEATILSRRARVSYNHAYLVTRGLRRSPRLETMLASIRAKLAAQAKKPARP